MHSGGIYGLCAFCGGSQLARTIQEHLTEISAFYCAVEVDGIDKSNEDLIRQYMTLLVTIGGYVGIVCLAILIKSR